MQKLLLRVVWTHTCESKKGLNRISVPNLIKFNNFLGNRSESCLFLLCFLVIPFLCFKYFTILKLCYLLFIQPPLWKCSKVCSANRPECVGPAAEHSADRCCFDIKAHLFYFAKVQMWVSQNLITASRQHFSTNSSAVLKKYQEMKIWFKTTFPVCFATTF